MLIFAHLSNVTMIKRASTKSRWCWCKALPNVHFFEQMDASGKKKDRLHCHAIAVSNNKNVRQVVRDCTWKRPAVVAFVPSPRSIKAFVIMLGESRQSLVIASALSPLPPAVCPCRSRERRIAASLSCDPSSPSLENSWPMPLHVNEE